MKHQGLIAKMTKEEKAAFLSGKTVWETFDFPRLGIPSIYCSDGPSGLRKQKGEGDHLGLNASLPATCFPAAACVANSWDIHLGEEIGAALGEEAKAQDVQVLLGPGLNIKRSPLCGRNFEYISEDPYLAGKMAAAYVKGIQSQGVYSCPKHFAVNSQELRRMSMDAVVDERTLREIYLTGFEIAVKEAGAKAIMTSYNRVNGTYANENRHLLLDILRKEWGFDGIVITDWGGSNNHVAGVACRSNLEMPCPGFDSAREILGALDSGKLTMEELDLCVDDLLDAVLVLSENAKNSTKKFSKKAHHAIARKAAAQSAVLLKNENHILPIKENTKVAIIGDFALKPRYQGAGSSNVNPTKVESISELVKQYSLQVVGIFKGYDRLGKKDEALKEEALALAKQAELVIYCFGLDELSESEGIDRTHMKIPRVQAGLLKALAKVNPNIVGVLSAGSPVEMPWENNCKAILHGYLGGQAGAGALLDLLTGKVNPSGRLNETYPMRYEDTPTCHHFPSKQRTAEYREGIFVGYRYYDTAKVPVRYPFGYGLSYTSFAYSDINADEHGVSFTLTNIGDRDGAEVAQMYVSLPKSQIFRPAKELKGFEKVFLKAGESRRISIPFDDKTFRYWNVDTNNWEREAGSYKIQIGANISDIKLQASVEIEGSTDTLPAYCKAETLPSYYSGKVQMVDDDQFKTILGHEIPDGSWNGSLDKNDAVCQMYYAKSRAARMVYKILTRILKKSEAKGEPNLNLLFIYNIPFRGIAKMTDGMVSADMVDGIITAVNGRFFKGLGQVVKGFFANRKANKAYQNKIRNC